MATQRACGAVSLVSSVAGGITSGPTGRHGPDWVLDYRGAFQAIMPDGTFIESWGTPGSAPGELTFDREIDDLYYGDISFAPDGSFYVAESGNHRVSRFDADRDYVLSWDSRSTGDGQFIDVIGVSIAPHGNVHVVADERDDVQSSIATRLPVRLRRTGRRT